MNNLSLIIICLYLLLLCGCANNTEVPGINCAASDLFVEVIDFTKSDCDQPGSITLDATGGEGEYTYSIDEINFQDSPDFENLFAGVFNVSAKDENGCIATKEFTLESEPTDITLNLTVTTSNCTSSTGSITAEASGGVGTLQYSIGGGSFIDSNEFTSVAPGKYTVTVIDEEGCRVSKLAQVKTNTSLSNDIMPIIIKDCAISGCHNGSQSPRLVSKNEVIANSAKIRSETQAGSMPRDGTLTQTEIDLIACWVEDGANDN